MTAHFSPVSSPRTRPGPLLRTRGQTGVDGVEKSQQSTTKEGKGYQVHGKSDVHRLPGHQRGRPSTHGEVRTDSECRLLLKGKLFIIIN